MKQQKSGTGRRVGGVLVLIATTVLVYILDKPMGELPALGRLLDPVSGCWANAESVDPYFSKQLKLPLTATNATVWWDNRMVPHIQAANDNDIYFLQGYIHAMHRLWQMDMQTRAAAGRVSEVVGQSAFDFDRKQRRKGMVFAAENSLRAAEADEHTSTMIHAYTAGVNAWIASLSYADYPLEYKLMGFSPEPWTNLKCVLLLKYMADDLTGKTDDIAYSYLRSVIPAKDFELLYPDKIPGAVPVIPAGTVYPAASLTQPLAPPDSLVFPQYESTDFGELREQGKGSNNWALSGSRTASGAAILCNDPHLALNLPSLWYEVQLQTPDMNVYGASLPGAPGVVIGFNDSISWGLTNNYRDVKDYYQIKPVEEDKTKYWFSGNKLVFGSRVEEIKVKGKSTFYDTVRYTLHGPVMYDEKFNEKGSLRGMLAMCWTGHRGSNEQLAVYKLNRAKNYDEFVNGILHFECPGQNMIYADRRGNIALWGQGQFVNKWKEQGRYIMNGWDSAALWQDMIPMRENPHALNPQQGYLASANQLVTDSTYPYWYNGNYTELRAWRINEVLDTLHGASIKDMFALQNDEYSVLAAKTLPMMLSYCTSINHPYLDTLRRWNYTLSKYSKAATIYQLWWRNLYSDIWKDEFSKVPDYTIPLQERTMQLILTDTALKYYDNRRTAKIEVLRDMVLRSYQETVDSLDKQQKTIGLEWYKAKSTSVTHLTKLSPFSYKDLATGGWGNTVNAMKPNHGPSWRMVVQMGKEIEAYGVYPGGQSGNPGSPNYASYLQHWVDGKYYRLLFLPNSPAQSSTQITHTQSVSKK